MRTPRRMRAPQRLTDARVTSARSTSHAGMITVSASSMSASVYGISIVNSSPLVECFPSCRPHTMNRYVGIPMSDRSSPNTSHGTAQLEHRRVVGDDDGDCVLLRAELLAL